VHSEEKFKAELIQYHMKSPLQQNGKANSIVGASPTFMARRSKQKHGVYNQHDSYNTSRPASADTREGRRGERKAATSTTKETNNPWMHARTRATRAQGQTRARGN
jgi:hypothetical protein